MSNILEILTKIEDGKTVTEQEKTDLVKFCDEKGWFDQGEFLTENSKYEFITSSIDPLITSDGRQAFLRSKLLKKTLNSENALEFFRDNPEIKQETSPLAIAYVFCSFSDEQRSEYKKLNEAQKKIFTGYLTASCNHYYPSGFELNRAEQPDKLSKFLNAVKDFNISPANSENLTDEQLVTFGKEIYIFDNILDKRLKKKLDNPYQGLSFLEQPTRINAASAGELNSLFTEKILKYEIAIDYIGVQDITMITYTFNENEIAGFDHGLKIKLIENYAGNTQRIISATYCPPEIVEKQKQAIIDTYNEVMNYDFSKLTPEEQTLFTAKGAVKDDKVNILSEMKKYTSQYTHNEIDVMVRILLKTYKEKSGIDDSFKYKAKYDYFDITASHNNALLEQGDAGHYTAAIPGKSFVNAKLEYVEFDKMLKKELDKQAKSGGKLYPSGLSPEDKVFFELNDVIMHEMHHAYQDYLMNKYIYNSPKIPNYKDTPEYEYALLCYHSQAGNLKYFDKPNEITPYSMMSFTDDLLVNLIFPDAKLNPAEYEKFHGMIGLNHNSADTVQEKLNFYKDNPTAVRSITASFDELGEVSETDLINLGKMIAAPEGQSYYFNASTNKIEVKQKQ